MSELLEDLRVEILLKLPVKSLLRFRCVSKSWCGLIDSKYFINTHLQRSINTNTNLHLILTSFKGNIYLVHFDDQVFSSSRIVKKLNNPFPYDSTTKIMGSCNGLLCLGSWKRDFHLALWNPFGRRYKILPKAVIPKCFKHIYAHSRWALKACKLPIYGFGYDDFNDDYKVVRIIQAIDFDLDCIKNEVKVYSLRLNIWRTIEDFPYGQYLFDDETQGCFVNGALHWLMCPNWRGEESEILIATFNVGAEVFGTLPFPKSDERFVEVAALGVVGGLLCVGAVYGTSVEVWVMKQYGVGESWFKLYSALLNGQTWIIPGNNYVKPLVCSRNGEKLLVIRNYNCLRWCDIKAKKEITINDIAERFESDMCLQSLVSLGDNSKFDEIKYY